MGLIRINELARELEVKSPVLIEYLVELGITDKKKYSHALDDEVADKVRDHFKRKAAEDSELRRRIEDIKATARKAVLTKKPE